MREHIFLYKGVFVVLKHHTKRWDTTHAVLCFRRLIKYQLALRYSVLVCGAVIYPLDTLEDRQVFHEKSSLFWFMKFINTCLPTGQDKKSLKKLLCYVSSTQ